MIFLITYDLKSPSENYTELHEAIRAQGAWWHHLESVWMIDTASSASSVRDLLTPHIGAEDKLLVIKVGKPWAARGFLERAYTWMHDRNF